jgi:hypothetical protein
MTRDHLDEQFEAYLTRDDDTLVGSQFFETMGDLERRRAQETIGVTLRLVNGQAQFEPSDHICTQGNVLWVGDKRVVVKMAEEAGLRFLPNLDGIDRGVSIPKLFVS